MTAEPTPIADVPSCWRTESHPAHDACQGIAGVIPDGVIAAAREALSPGARQLLDTLAAVGGFGWLTAGRGRTTRLEVLAAGGHRRVRLARYAGATTDQLLAAHFMVYSKGRLAEGVQLTEAGRMVAEPERRRRELAGIARIPGEVS